MTTDGARLAAEEVMLLAADGATRTSTSEAVVFWVLGTVAVLGASGVVAARKAVYSAGFLACTMIACAVLYVAQDALFLGVVQVVVYTGAVMMLFLFVLMLIGVDLSESLVETLRGQRIAALGVGVGFGVLLIAGIGNVSVAGFTGLAEANSGGNVEGLAALIFTRYLWACELTSTLLITAALGAARPSANLPSNASRPAVIRLRCPIPVCTRATTPSTSRRGSPTGRTRPWRSARSCRVGPSVVPGAGRGDGVNPRTRGAI